MNSCPFCGAGEDEKPVDGRAMSPVVRGDFTECRACGARGPTVYWQDREPFTSRILRVVARAEHAEARAGQAEAALGDLDRWCISRLETLGPMIIEDLRNSVFRRHNIDPETL